MDNFRIGDEFFLITHDGDTGRPRISRELAGAGLVAGLIAELVLEERARIDSGLVQLCGDTDTGEAASDFLARSLADQHADHPVRTWIQNLGEIGYELITRRLVERGTLRRVQARRRLGLARGKDTFPAADKEAVEPALWLNIVAVNPEQADTQRRTLAGLLVAAGGEGLLPAARERPGMRSALSDLAAELPEDLQQLIRGFREAVLTLSISVRR